MTDRNLFRETEPNKLVPSVMTNAERELHRTIQEAKSNVDSLRSQLLEAENVFNEYRKSCEHRIFFDCAGIPYTIRFCGICDSKLETI